MFSITSTGARGWENSCVQSMERVPACSLPYYIERGENMQFQKGDIIRGLKEATQHYNITKGGTQWTVYDTEFDNILLGRVLSTERYIELQNEYDNTEDKGLSCLVNGLFWVRAEYFTLVYRRVINSNSEALGLLEKEEVF